MDNMFFQTEILIDMLDEMDADGSVYHPIKSCRTVSTGSPTAAGPAGATGAPVYSSNRT